MNVGL